jgi:hypothetical protein
MATRVQIQCINKSDRFNPHERIQNVGGVNGDGTRWRITQPDAINYIDNGTYAFYVSVGGNMVDVIVSSHNGNKYIKTVSDGLQPDNLLSLPECP